jgi:GDP-mannose 6-dehydrogenase
MELFCMDNRLNISKAYLRPGFAFGGSCLPKDVRALAYHSRDLDVDSPLLNSLLDSNWQHIQRAIDMVEATGCKKIGVLGLSFKAGTDDVRESPIMPVIETLVGRGYDITIFDQQLELSKLIGQNKAFLERDIPHIEKLMRPSAERVIEDSEVIVIANDSQQFRHELDLVRDDQIVIDLVGVLKQGSQAPKGEYHGLCW